MFALPSHFVDEGRPALDWATRVKVAAGAARGIAYLHEDCNYLYFSILLDNDHIHAVTVI